MAKSKLHPLAKQLGFKSNADFYKQYPTQDAYEMACGGALPHKMKKGGSFVENFPYIQTDQQFFSPGFYNTYNPNNGSSLQYGGIPIAQYGKVAGTPFQQYLGDYPSATPSDTLIGGPKGNDPRIYNPPIL